jgi:hypothetical protein
MRNPKKVIRKHSSFGGGEARSRDVRRERPCQKA